MGSTTAPVFLAAIKQLELPWTRAAFGDQTPPLEQQDAAIAAIEVAQVVELVVVIVDADRALSPALVPARAAPGPFRCQPRRAVARQHEDPRRCR